MTTVKGMLGGGGVIVDDAAAQAMLLGIKGRMLKAYPAYKVIAEQLRTMVIDTFKAEGARNGNPKWKPLKPNSIMKRLKRRKSFFSKKTGKLLSRGQKFLGSMKILQDRLRLIRSIKARSSRNWAQAGTNVSYGPAHQMGMSWNNLPARPFIDVTQPDIDKAAATLKNYVIHGVAADTFTG